MAAVVMVEVDTEVQATEATEDIGVAEEAIIADITVEAPAMTGVGAAEAGVAGGVMGQVGAEATGDVVTLVLGSVSDPDIPV